MRLLDGTSLKVEQLDIVHEFRKLGLRELVPTAI
jgi:hypothetical protein